MHFAFPNKYISALFSLRWKSIHVQRKGVYFFPRGNVFATRHL